MKRNIARATLLFVSVTAILAAMVVPAVALESFDPNAGYNDV
jgi:hypothetical protein